MCCSLGGLLLLPLVGVNILGGAILHLLTKQLINQFPKRYETDGLPKDQIPIIAKFFTPWSNCTWYATEFCPIDQLFFGFCHLGFDDCAELGYFSLHDLQSLKGPFGLRVERDQHFNATLDEVMSFKKR
jgi:hypothetical protein